MPVPLEAVLDDTPEPESEPELALKPELELGPAAEAEAEVEATAVEVAATLEARDDDTDPTLDEAPEAIDIASDESRLDALAAFEDLEPIGLGDFDPSEDEEDSIVDVIPIGDDGEDDTDQVEVLRLDPTPEALEEEVLEEADLDELLELDADELEAEIIEDSDEYQVGDFFDEMNRKVSGPVPPECGGPRSISE